MQLAAQSIRALCVGLGAKPMIEPFVDQKQVVNGKSYGLSACSYDCRIDHDLTLWPGESALANTMEDFCMPADVVGYVVDKSSFARVFVTAFNTLIDPGFHGNLTLELVNLGKEVVHYKKGDPVVQIAFHWLDRKTDRPYAGKYQHQTKQPHPARYELEAKPAITRRCHKCSADIGSELQTRCLDCWCPVKAEARKDMHCADVNEPETSRCKDKRLFPAWPWNG